MSAPALWRTLALWRLLQWYVSSAFGTFSHILNIRTGLKRLRKVADVADNVFISFERKWYDGLLNRLVHIAMKRCGHLHVFGR